MHKYQKLTPKHKPSLTCFAIIFVSANYSNGLLNPGSEGCSLIRRAFLKRSPKKMECLISVWNKEQRVWMCALGLSGWSRAYLLHTLWTFTPRVCSRQEQGLLSAGTSLELLGMVGEHLPVGQRPLRKGWKYDLETAVFCGSAKQLICCKFVLAGNFSM